MHNNSTLKTFSQPYRGGRASRPNACQTHLLDCASPVSLQENEAFIDGKIFVRDSFGGYMPKEKLLERTKIRKPADAAGELAQIRMAEQEHFMVILLDGSNAIIESNVVTVGLVNQSQIHPRETFRQAVAQNAVTIILAHNHPSGNLEPSESDLAATRRLVEAGKVLGIPVMDHIIVASTGLKSLREGYPAYFS